MNIDGIAYKLFIDPLLRNVRRAVLRLIDANSRIIDIASGTGTMAMALASKCSYVVGVDLSESMIETAKIFKRRNDMENLHFVREDATNLAAFKKNSFDYAVLSMALHQFASELRNRVMAEALRIAGCLIIVDYSVPRPRNLFGVVSLVIERLAGKEHYANYQSYMQSNGAENLITENRLAVRNEISSGGGVFTIHMLSKKVR